MWLKIPLLQRYLFGEVLRVFLFVLGCITILLLFVGVFQEATDRGLSPLEALKILPFVIPNLLPFTIPSALLLTVSAVYGRLSGDQELTAAKSAGIHPVSLMWPALLLGGVLSLCSLLMTDQVIPWSFDKMERHVISVMEDIFLDRLRTEHQFSDPSHGLLVTVTGVNGRRLVNPIFRYVKGDRICTLVADEAEIDLDMDLHRALIRARNSCVDIPGAARAYIQGPWTEAIRWDWGASDAVRKPRNLPIANIESEVLAIDRQLENQRQRAAIEACFSLTQADFPRLISTAQKRLTGSNAQTNRRCRLKTEVHSRFALACSCFFFVLLGTPFAMCFGKSQYLTNFLLCFLPIVCGYYPLMLGLITQAKKGHIGPEWSMWVANACLAAGAWAVLRRVIRY